MILLISVIALISVVTIVKREAQEPDRSYPEAKSSATPDLSSRDAELVVAAYIKAAQENNEKALLGYIADLATLPHRQRKKKNPQSTPELDPEDKRAEQETRIPRAGRNTGIIDEVGNDLLPKEEPEYIRNLRLVVEKMESKCSTPSNCRVRVFFAKFENREIVHDYVVYHIDEIGWRIVSVLPALDW